jgi:ribonuclease P/MRP protein subunit POP1
MLPPSWSMPFLSSLVHTGTRVVGLSARHHQRLESRSPHFPDDYIGVPAYTDMVTGRAKIERAKWERIPKGKRVNFEALGVTHPWLSDWDGLVGSPPSGAILADLIPTERVVEESPVRKPWLFSFSEIDQLIRDAADSQQDSGIQVFAERINFHRARRGLPTIDDDLIPELFDSALVNVHVDMLGRGNPSDRAILYGCNTQEEMSGWVAAIESQRANNCDLNKVGS